MKRVFLLLVFLMVFNVQGQSIHDYQYVIVPTRFDFQRTENEYRLNTIVKYHLTQMGFKTFYDTDELPSELSNNRCGKLYLSIKKYSPFLSTKLEITLKDCQKNVVFQSSGTTKEKEYKVAYLEALEKALESLYAKGYVYNGNDGKPSLGGMATTTAEAAIKAPAAGDAISDLTEQDVLYAQIIEGGYQVVNNVPKVVFKIFKTSSDDIYLATIGTYEGVLLSKNGRWILEYKKDGQLVSKAVNIKF